MGGKVKFCLKKYEDKNIKNGVKWVQIMELERQSHRT